uniref:Uncharacterized protein n=1 Tax=Anguilla anguilla TaxID=7936 RepID=A0A0E9T6H8_ANGAN
MKCFLCLPRSHEFSAFKNSP